MLRLSDIRFSIAGKPLFDGAAATIPAGHKVGLVGRNGTGKTTLFRLIRGELALESGEIDLPRGARIGGVAQEVPGSDVSATHVSRCGASGSSAKWRLPFWTRLPIGSYA